jgi:hypothetical protein
VSLHEYFTAIGFGAADVACDVRMSATHTDIIAIVAKNIFFISNLL